MSSKMIPYVFIPLEMGQVEVEVKVVGEARDHVRKTLLVRVMGEQGFAETWGHLIPRKGGGRTPGHSPLEH